MNSNWSYSPETVKLGRDLCDLDLWPLTLTFCMDITFDHGNNSWKFHDDTMMGTWWKRCDRQTDRRTDGRTENTICRAAWSQLKTICDIVCRFQVLNVRTMCTNTAWTGFQTYSNKNKFIKSNQHIDEKTVLYYVSVCQVGGWRHCFLRHRSH